MIYHAVVKAFNKKRAGGWECWPNMYWAIDLHDVIVPASYKKTHQGLEFAFAAKEVLQWLTRRTDMCLILYTCSHDSYVKEVLRWMETNGVQFDYINENPEVESDDLRNVGGKFYFDVVLEDKAGFDLNYDWGNIKGALEELEEWDKKTSHNETEQSTT